MKVDFGESKDDYELRRHPRLEAREVAMSSLPVSSVSSKFFLLLLYYLLLQIL
jgi:hypothetical protein